MVRVTNYFETQVRIPIPMSGDPSNLRLSGSAPTGARVHSQNASPANRKMTDEQMVSWYGKVLDGVRWRYRKLQRFAR
jgi:mitogen-activated protein kinase kinase kinase